MSKNGGGGGGGAGQRCSSLAMFCVVYLNLITKPVSCKMFVSDFGTLKSCLVS